MTTPTSTTTATAAAEATAFGAEDFTTGEGLRALLNRLFERAMIRTCGWSSAG